MCSEPLVTRMRGNAWTSVGSTVGVSAVKASQPCARAPCGRGTQKIERSRRPTPPRGCSGAPSIRGFPRESASRNATRLSAARRLAALAPGGRGGSVGILGRVFRALRSKPLRRDPARNNRRALASQLTPFISRLPRMGLSTSLRAPLSVRDNVGAGLAPASTDASAEAPLPISNRSPRTAPARCRHKKAIRPWALEPIADTEPAPPRRTGAGRSVGGSLALTRRK